MQNYLENEFNIFLLGLFVMLVVGKLFGKCAKSFGFAGVTGEIIAGVLLGPTFISALNIDFYQIFFSKSNGTFFNLFFQLSLILMMFITGLKLDLRQAANNLRKTFYITFFGILFPLVTGIVVACFLQKFFILTDSKYPHFVFPIFMGVAFSISAIPVIAKILMDIKILHTPTGAIIISTAFLVDIICWGIFIMLTQAQSPGLNNLLILMGCFIVLFILKNSLAPKLFKYLDKHVLSSDISGSIGICFLFAILFQFLHLDACFGAFLAGIFLNNILSSAEIKNTLTHWIMNFFAPLFFVSIGIKIDFLSNFNWELVLLVFGACSISKIAGTFIGAHLSGVRGVEKIVISLALNARGTIEIVFSTIALNLGIISNSTYVALITMALLTSILSGILLKKIIHQGASKMFNNGIGLPA